MAEKTKAPAFQFYASDFIAATLDWPSDAVGAYMRLLSFQWINGAIPATTARLRAIMGFSDAGGDPLPLWETYISAKFEDRGDGMMVNRRLEQVRAEQTAHREKLSARGRKGAAAKHGLNYGTSTQQADAKQCLGTTKADAKQCLDVDQKVALQSSVFSLQSPTPSSSPSPPSETPKPPKGASRGNRQFQPPTLSEVQAYAAESIPKLGDVECERFFDHFTSNGWKVGGKAPMKDWKAALRNWSRNDFRAGPPAKAPPLFRQI